VRRLVEAPIRSQELMEQVRGDGDGAVALFLGTVRDHNEGRRVLRLEYHAYPEMAESEMRRIEEEALDRFEVSRVAVVHRSGTLAIGEASVAVAVAAAHRAAAMEACRWAIDTLKTRVPIWKKEFFEDGEVWVEPRPEGSPDS
jgi:molybdopterin synthase catalytic subunit